MRVPDQARYPLVPNVPPAPPSVASDQHVYRFDALFTWHLLDFGVSYYRAREQANKTLSKNFEYERIRQNIVLNVIEHYWKARAALRGIKGGTEIVKKAKVFQEKREKEISHRTISTIEGYKSEAELVRTILQVQVFEKEYHNEIYELTKLMGLKPGIEFELAEDDLFPPL